MNDAAFSNENIVCYEPIMYFWKNNNLYKHSNAYYKVKLEDCLEHFTAVEEMNDPDNLYHCEHCRQSDPDHESEAITRLLFRKPPWNLVINLKRFTEGARGWKKSNRDVIFPIILELDRFMVHEVEE